MFETALVFLATMGIISLPFYKKTKTKEGYYLSSRKMGTTTLSFTLAATTIGGSAIIITLKLMEKYGKFGIIPDIAGGMGLIILSMTLAGKVRKTKAITLPSMLKSKTSKSIYIFIALGLVIAEICWIGLSVKSIQIIGNLTIFQTAAITAGIVFYSLIGGQWSVSKTDIIQLSLILAGLIWYAFGKPPATEIQTGNIEITLIYIASIMLFSHIIGPDIYSKILSAKDEKTAKKGTFIGGFLKILFSVLLIFAVKKGFSLSNINILIFLIVFSAIVSSIDSMLITSTSMVCEDLFKTEKRWKIKTATVLIAILSFSAAVFTPDILNLLKSGYTVLFLTVAFPVISLFANGTVERNSLFLPLIAFFIVFFVSKSTEASFFASIFAGGTAVAYNKIHGGKENNNP